MNDTKDLSKRVFAQDQPPVSVIIPAYNAARFIARTLRSALNQTYRNLEVIVIDDGSTDDTAQIVQSMATTDSRIRYYHQSNAGVAAARNYGIERSTGELIAPLDADDLWHETNLAKQVALLASAPANVGMTYVWSVDIDENDCLTGNVRVSAYTGNVYPALFYFNVVGNGSACLIRRSCFDQVGGYSPEFRAQQAQGCEDWDLYLRITKHYHVALIPELLVGYRQVDGSMSTHSTVMNKSRELVFYKNSRQYPKVYREVSRWVSSISHIYALSQYLQDQQDEQAWDCLKQALQADPLIVLTTYANWVFICSLMSRALTSRIQSKHQKNRFESLNSKISTYLRFIFLPFFPAWLIRRFRMLWVTAQVCPREPSPTVLPPWQLSKPRISIRLQAEQNDCPVEFSQQVAHLEVTQQQPIDTVSSIQR
jgi:glycosyltransferase involved in cell wall biosynthesis